MSWTVHLAPRYPGKLMFVLGAAGLATFCGWLAIGPVGALAALVLVTGSLTEFLFPVKYALSINGATSRALFKTTHIPWSRVKRCYLDDFGVKLSTLETPSRLEAYRGLYLRFGDNKDQVIETIKSLRPKQ